MPRPARISGGGSTPAEYRLSPHYRVANPLQSVLAKVDPARDTYVTERYASHIERIFGQWCDGLKRSSADQAAIAKALTSDFSGFSLRATNERILRSDPNLEIYREGYSEAATKDRQSFLGDLKSFFSVYSEILTAEVLLTEIELLPPGASAPAGAQRLRTRARYDFVATGHDFHREERVGRWDMEWEIGKHLRIRAWRALDETRSRASHPVFVDITGRALDGNACNAGQLLHGADYWRTVLDGAAGIDVYGHNGVAAGDFDNDGFDDLYICQPAGLPNRLFRNRGDGTFEDVTDHAGVGVLENTACALFLDVRNSGMQDLMVVRADGPRLFVNQGGGKFKENPAAFRFARPPQGTFTGAAAADYDRDGLLDIYFPLYIYYQGVAQYHYPAPYDDAENGPPNFLMRNNGDGTFRDVTEEAGLNRNNTRYSFCCGWSDFDGDGWPDLYVVNDFGRKNLYRNRRDGTFTDVAPKARVEDVGAGMSVCWFDYDNDGRQDLYVADMGSSAGKRVTMQSEFMPGATEEVLALYRKHSMGNSLFRNRGDGSFADASASAGVAMGRWAWSSDAWDFDCDGFPDLYIANGMISGPRHDDLASFFWRQVVAKSPPRAEASTPYEQGWSVLNDLIRSDSTWNGYERNVFYVNNRDGTFSHVSGAVGMDFVEDGRAFALADLDHDGRVEVVLKNRNAPQIRILQNRMQRMGEAIAFRLRGTKSNRDAIGAAITLESHLGKQTRYLQAGSGFLSQHSKEIFFGLGGTKGTLSATVRWPSGMVQQFHGLPAGHHISIVEGSEAVHAERFVPQVAVAQPGPTATRAESVPSQIETWLIAPVAAPEFSLPDVTGQSRPLASFRGRALLLSFWATDAPACTELLEIFQKRHATWAQKGLQLAAININQPEEADSIREYVRTRGLTFPILLASEDVAGIYNLLYRYLFDRHRDLGIPTSFLLDGGGRIVKVYQGPVDAWRVEQDFRHIPRTLRDRMAAALPFPGITDATDFPRNYLSYGSVYFQHGYYSQAESSFRLALEDNPASAEAWYGVGSACLELQKTAEAQASFEKALHLSPGYPDTWPNSWNNLGIIAARKGRQEEAMEYFQKALELNPSHLIALENLGNVYRQQKRWDEARRTFERALGVSPGDAEANYSLGMVYAQLDDTQHAYDYLQKALAARPDYPEALNNLGILLVRMGRPPDAVASFEKCKQLAPSYDQPYLNLAKVYMTENEPQKARAVLLELLKQHPGHPLAEKMLMQLPR